MNYYEQHIGDYAKDAGHLSLIEDGAYRRLLDAYYTREEPLPGDLKACCKLARATTKPEREAVAYVVREFFELREDGYHQKRCDAEIERFRVKQEKARRSANARWNPEPSGSERNAGAMRTHSEGNAPRARPQSPVTSHQTPEDQEPTTADAVVVAGKPPTPDCPHAEIVALYHECLPSLRRVREWKGDRQAFLRSRWRERPERQSLAWWRGFFEYVSGCPLLMGEVPGRDGGVPFSADLEWLVRPTNFRKVIEGRYQRRAA